MLRRLLDPPLQEAVRAVRKRAPSLHPTSREFANEAMQAAWASLRRRMRAQQAKQQQRTAERAAKGAAEGAADATQARLDEAANRAEAEANDEVQVVQEVTSHERDTQLRREAIVLGDSDDEDETALEEGTLTGKRQKL